MGLDIGCKCGNVSFRAASYGGFHEWRKKLAQYVRIDLDKMRGFHGSKPWTTRERFYHLLNHSDCDGHLTYRQCRKLLHDFDWLHQKLTNPNNIQRFWQYLFQSPPEDWWLEKFDKWHEAIRHAVSMKCWLLFG